MNMDDVPKPVLSLEFSNYASAFEELEERFSTSKFTLLISRLDHRTLATYIGFDRMKVFWLTKRLGQLTILPDISVLENCILDHLKESELIVFEGIDWLFEIYEEQDVYQFIARLQDVLQSHHQCIILYQPLTLTPIQYARIRRLAPSATSKNLSPEVAPTKKSTIEHSVPLNTDESETNLRMLTTLPKLGFSKDHVAKRILQWKRMGFDVSSLQPALSMRNIDDAYQLYLHTEEKIRRAIELLREVDSRSNELSAKILQRSRYNLYQLENFEDVEKWLIQPSY
jgi:hypothetical protein